MAADGGESKLADASARTIDHVLLQHEIEQFLYAEAALLDERRFREWADLLTDDVDYWMPVRMNRRAGDEMNEFTRPGEGAFFDEDKACIEERIRKLATGFTWAEDPASRTRHIVNNVRILGYRDENQVEVTCNFLLYRSRLASDEDFWIGRREDTLRKVGARWMIARRHIFLDQVSLKSKNLSIFF